jgi:hypothetical protein
MLFGKGHRIGGLHPIAEGKSIMSGDSRRHVGGASNEIVSRENEIVVSSGLYISCM